MNNFKIAEGYISNLTPGHHNDIPYTDGGQLEVYLFALGLMKKNNYSTVIDVGCGSGFKLMTYFSEYKTIGYEVEPCLSMLREKYPKRIWIDSGEAERDFNYSDIRAGDILICSDVIEHIIDPSKLLNYLKEFDTRYIVLSTPCREVLCNDAKLSSIYGGSVNGPPINGAHVREWTMKEFIEFTSEHFNVLESHYGKNQVECQYHLLEKK